MLPEDEQSFWEIGVFSMDTAQGLTNAVFFFITAKLLIFEVWKSMFIWKRNSFPLKQTQKVNQDL